MTDLDALERAFDQAEELPFVRMPTLRKVVAELRASRKVAEAAWDIAYDDWPYLDEHQQKRGRLAHALDDLQTVINDMRKEGE